MTRAPGRGELVLLDVYEPGEYDSCVKVQGKLAIDVAQFLKLRPGGLVLVHANGEDLANVCRTTGIPYRIVKGLYVQDGARVISSSLEPYRQTNRGQHSQ